MSSVCNLHPNYTAATVAYVAAELKAAIDKLYEIAEVRCFRLDVCCAEYYAAEHFRKYFDEELADHVDKSCNDMDINEVTHFGFMYYPE